LERVTVILCRICVGVEFREGERRSSKCPTKGRIVGEQIVGKITNPNFCLASKPPG